MFRKDERKEKTTTGYELTRDMIFRSYPAPTNPGGVLRTISGKAEKWIHDEAFETFHYLKKPGKTLWALPANTTLIFQVPDL
jgi:hypothetical protein